MAKRKHGGHGTRLYRIWQSMKARCNIPSATGYSIYGARGISVCAQWENSYVSFRDWALSNGYDDNLTIDRINVNGDYEPENCRWTTMQGQANNTRRNHIITINGEAHTVAEWSRKTGVSEHNIYNRIINLGWSEKEAITKQPKKIVRDKVYVALGESHTLSGWAKKLNINYFTLYDRINKCGMEIEKALLLRPKGSDFHA